MIRVEHIDLENRKFMLRVEYADVHELKAFLSMIDDSDLMIDTFKGIAYATLSVKTDNHK